MGIPSVLHVRAPKSPELFRKHDCHKASAVIAISRQVYQNLLDAGVERSRIRTIYDAVDLEKFSPRNSENVLRQEYPWAQGVLVGLAGRIKESKRQLDFVKTAAAISRENPSVTFFIIGEPYRTGYFDRIYKFIIKNGLSRRIILTGRREDMPAVLSSLDMLVTLSGGSVMIESMACGTPVISAGFTKPENSAIVLDSQTGILLGPGEENRLPDAIRRLMDDEPLRRKFALAGRRHVEEHFGRQAMGLATQQLYDDLLNKK